MEDYLCDYNGISNYRRRYLSLSFIRHRKIVTLFNKVATKQYNGEAIRLMTELVLTNSSHVFNTMVEKDLRELIEGVEFIRSGKEASFKWLMDNHYLAIAAFANAVRGDKTAFRWLMKNKEVFWAATANAVNKDMKALAWLQQNKFIVYAELAEAIVKYDQNASDSDTTSYHRSPF